MEPTTALSLLIACGGFALLILMGVGVLIYVQSRPHSTCRAEILALRNELESYRDRVMRAVRKKIGDVEEGSPTHSSDTVPTAPDVGTESLSIVERKQRLRRALEAGKRGESAAS